MNLTKEDRVSKYEDQGFLTYDNVLDADLMEEAKRHVDWLLNKNPDLRPEQLHTNLIHDDPFWLRLVGDDRLLDIAETFIGSDIALFASHYICKPAYTGQPVLWHQDGSYWPLEPMKVVTLWLAVDDSVPENGCLRVIPRTHALELQRMQSNYTVENVLGSEIEKKYVDESKAVDLILRSGSVSIHHPNIIHGSKANASPMRRCGLTIRYIPTSTKVLNPDHRVYLLRGRALEKDNRYAPMPEFDSERHMPFRDSERFAFGRAGIDNG